MQPHYFVFKGAKVAYWEYNPDKKPTIVMVHGFRGTHHGLEKIVEQLPDFHIIVPDLPGFGDSQPFSGTPHFLESYVDFLYEFLKHLAFSQPPVLLGHSFGSIVASHYAALHGETIAKLILVNPIGAPALKGPKGAMTRLAIMYYWLGRTLPEKPSHAWLANKLIVRIMSETMAKSKDKSMRKFINDQHLAHFSTFANPAVVAESFRASVGHDVREVAAKITVPTLLIAGERDDITPLSKEKELAAAITDSHLHVIGDVGHLIHYETPREAAEAITTFLDEPR